MKRRKFYDQYIILAKSKLEKELYHEKTKKQCEVKCGSVNHMKRVSAFLLGAALTLCLTAAKLRAADQLPVDLGSAANFAVLGASTVTNTGPTIINGDIGVWPGTAFVPGTPPATVNGTIHAGDTVAQQAQAALTVAFNNAAGRFFLILIRHCFLTGEV